VPPFRIDYPPPAGVRPILRSRDSSGNFVFPAQLAGDSANLQCLARFLGRGEQATVYLPDPSRGPLLWNQQQRWLECVAPCGAQRFSTPIDIRSHSPFCVAANSAGDYMAVDDEMQNAILMHEHPKGRLEILLETERANGSFCGHKTDQNSVCKA